MKYLMILICLAFSILMNAQTYDLTGLTEAEILEADQQSRRLSKKIRSQHGDLFYPTPIDFIWVNNKHLLKAVMDNGDTINWCRIYPQDFTIMEISPRYNIRRLARVQIDTIVRDSVSEVRERVIPQVQFKPLPKRQGNP